MVSAFGGVSKMVRARRKSDQKSLQDLAQEALVDAGDDNGDGIGTPVEGGGDKADGEKKDHETEQKKTDEALAAEENARQQAMRGKGMRFQADPKGEELLLAYHARHLLHHALSAAAAASTRVRQLRCGGGAPAAFLSAMASRPATKAAKAAEAEAETAALLEAETRSKALWARVDVVCVSLPLLECRLSGAVRGADPRDVMTEARAAVTHAAEVAATAHASATRRDAPEAVLPAAGSHAAPQ